MFTPSASKETFPRDFALELNQTLLKFIWKITMISLSINNYNDKYT